MAAATHPPSSLEITTADDMDLHSDHGALDYDDGDIDLDLDPPPSYAHDDDVSINDAASVSGMDAQTAPGGEHDDYMVDQEDVIEEDYSFQGDDSAIVAEQQPAMADAAVTQAEQAIQDEDLLDYSDEDDDYHDTALRSPWLQKHSMQDGIVQTEDAAAQQDEIPADLQALMSMTTSKDSQSPYADPNHAADKSPEADKHEASPRPQSAGHDEEDGQTGGDDGGVQLQGHQECASSETGPDDSAHVSRDHDESSQENEHQGDDSFELPPVTVNYLGEELWLFKHHDYENSGAWLIEDVSVARTSISDLFQACRSALGTGVPDGMELGFRFDHLQNMELFEESTACVAVSLERLVGYYYSLHEQDGNNEPDSFYMTLLHRPRFATLLADIAGHADKGSGYSGFEAAIAAGETHFHSVSVGLPSDELTEWEPEILDEEEIQVQVDVVEGEQDEVDTEERQHLHDEQQEHEKDAAAEEPVEGQAHQEDEGPAPAEAQVQSKEEEGHDDAEDRPQQVPEHEHDHDEEDNAQGDDEEEEEEEGGVEVDESEETVAEHASGQSYEGDNGEDNAPQATNPSEVPTDPQEAVDHPEQTRSQSGDRTEAEMEARRLQEQGDLIDYSDEEDEPSPVVEEAEQAGGTELSPSSATVRGGDSINAEKPVSVAGSPHLNEQTAQDHDGASFDTAEEPNAGNEPDQPEGNDDEHSYQDYVEAFEEDDLSHEIQVDEAGDNAANLQHDGDANQEYADYEYQDYEQQPGLDFTNGEEFNAGGNTGTGGDDFTGTNDFLDLDDTQWVVGQELSQEAPDDTSTAHDGAADTQDQEDGVAAQPENATSSAADPTTASSTDANDVSPQGHKRSIDEAGHGVDTAPDSIDAKRARV